ncbi:hypothetical protein BDN72DRAFT_849409 [Pluteus cervinus]|uniref:Uncharacterized protein n=1 Tax=Pluteus cervinus TaxID=181527 RepID=A0ACD3A7S9_9AGAR|nr:hypothetical protein BDN72DRAFT_849409 [Pluteus cervinus]
MSSSAPDVVFANHIHGLSVEEAHSKLAEIAQLEARLLFLRNLRNSVVPITKIPIELLSKIFSHCSEDSNNSSFPIRDDLDVNTRFSVSWVCRHWRNIALATSSLWTVVSMKSQDTPVQMDFVREMLFRSRGLCLTLNLFKPPMDVLTKCLSEMHRTRHLRFFSKKSAEKLDPFISQPAPLLTSFHLLEHLDSDVSPFLRNYTNLRHLTISRSSRRIWSTLIFPTLTTLHIIEPQIKIWVIELVGRLGSLPSLAELVLVKCFCNESVIAPSHRLDRPNIQTLSITDWMMESVFGFLNCLDIPQAGITIIWAEDGDNMHWDRMDSISTRLEHYRREVSFEIHHLGILDHPPQPPNFSFNISSTPTQHRLSLRFPEGAMPDFVHSLCDKLSLTHLRSLTTDTSAFRLFSPAETLDELRVVEVYGSDPLGSIASRFCDQTAEMVLFPALQELKIHKVKADVAEEALNRLEKGLAIRMEAGYRLSRLEFVASPTVNVDRFKHLADVLSAVD